MRVLLANSLFPPHPASGGGGDRIAGWLAEGLRDAGEEVEVLTTRLPLGTTASDGVHAILHPSGDWETGRSGSLGSRIAGAFTARADLGAVGRLLDARRPDVLVAGALINTHPSFLLSAVRRRIPIVLWIFTARETEYLSETRARLLACVFRATGGGDPNVLRAGRLAAVVAPSRFLLSEATRRGVRARIEMVIPHGIPTNRFAPTNESTTGPPWRIFWSGRLIPEKGFLTALEALARLRAHGIEAEATFAGRAWPEDLERFRETVAMHRLGKAIEWIGHVEDPARLAQVAGRHHLYWMTSRLPEGLPLGLLEGLSCGLPAVATDVGANPEVFEDGVEGFFVPADDPSALAERTERILATPSRRREMATAARARAVRFHSIERFSKSFRSLLRDVSIGRP